MLLVFDLLFCLSCKFVSCLLSRHTVFLLTLVCFIVDLLSGKASALNRFMNTSEVSSMYSYVHLLPVSIYCNSLFCLLGLEHFDKPFSQGESTS